MKLWMLWGVMSVAWCGLAMGAQRLDLEGTSVVGSHEAPNVLHIVPWRKSLPGEPMAPPALDLEDAVAPLDREVFRRRIEYYRAAHPKP